MGLKVANAAIICARCGAVAPRTGPVQKYCRPCSSVKAGERSATWENKNGPRIRKEERSLVVAEGAKISAVEAMSLINFVRPIELIWCTRIAIPFSWAASKNRVYHPHVRGGHLALREEVREYRALIGERLTAALGEQIVVQNRVWIALLVQKTAQKGDAINVVDTVCDAIKDVIGVDDRWFSIRYLDWQIVKENPRLYIEIGQESAEAVQACSSCGRILPFAEFQKNRANRSGHSRNCRECVRPRDLDRVAKRKAKAA